MSVSGPWCVRGITSPWVHRSFSPSTYSKNKTKICIEKLECNGNFEIRKIEVSKFAHCF